MEIGNRQQLGLSVRQPVGARLSLAFWAVPVAAGVIGAADDAARLTCFDMAAQRRRAAQFDGAHHAPLDAAEVTVMGASVGFAIAAEDSRHFQIGRHGRQSGGRRRDLQRQAVERALRPADQSIRDFGVTRRAGQIGVAE